MHIEISKGAILQFTPNSMRRIDQIYFIKYLLNDFSDLSLYAST